MCVFLQLLLVHMWKIEVPGTQAIRFYAILIQRIIHIIACLLVWGRINSPAHFYNNNNNLLADSLLLSLLYTCSVYQVKQMAKLVLLVAYVTVRGCDVIVDY